MSDTDADLNEDLAPSTDDGSIRASVERLVASCREMAEAELDWARLKAASIADGLRKWLILTMLALIFLMTGVVIIIVAAIIALAPYVGWLGASLIVAGISILAAAIAAFAARRIFLALINGDAS